MVLVVLELYMRRKHFLPTVAGLLALAFASSLFARGLFWDFLGRTQVDSSQDHSRVQITRHDVHFRTIQLRVSGEGIFFDRIVVQFDGGACQEVIVGDRISPGAKNYVIKLLGERSLESVDLWYYREPWGQSPTVSIYGTDLPEPDAKAMARDQ